ncbi:MAG: outer membrane lipoprotein-sorting protein, partial [Deltaproteobacteria bacterium]|nr:outer membrane lipoprotein-sorting protein [Deltaproteobacteria bacterium]
MEFPHISRWSHAMADSYGAMTSGGYLSQGITIGLNFYMPGDGVPGQIYQTVPGKDYYRMVFYYTSPPEVLGAQDLWILYRTDQNATTKLDYFAYAPSLRRVRRLPQPRRGERFPNNVQSFDDIVGRDAWEFSWRLLGTDVIHETVRFPNTRPSITLASPDGKFTDVLTAQLKMMGDTYPFYTTDGGIECYVVEAVTRPDWLPNYPASKLIYWLDRHYFYPLRQEQYD